MIVIAPMKEKDILAVVAIEARSFRFPKPEAVFREDEHKYLVARDENKIVGYIGIEKILDEVHCHPYGVNVARLGALKLQAGAKDDFLGLIPNYSHQPNIREFGIIQP